MHPIRCIPLLLSWSFNFPNFPNHIIKCSPLPIHTSSDIDKKREGGGGGGGTAEKFLKMDDIKLIIEVEKHS